MHVLVSQRGSWTCEELHTDSETLRQRSTVIVRNAEESWDEDKLEENTWENRNYSLAPSSGLLGTCQKLYSKDLDIQEVHLKDEESAICLSQQPDLYKKHLVFICLWIWK